MNEWWIYMYNILVVDDEIIAVKGIRKLLRTYQYPLKVYEACDGEEAKRILEEEPIHIMMTDIELPLINGLELIEIAKKNHPHIKTIVFSAYSNFEYARKAISLDAKQYLLKPIDVKEFQNVMQACLEECDKEFGSNEGDLLFADVFKNGTVEYEVLENIPFFRRESKNNILYSMCYLKFSSPILVNKELDDFVHRNVEVPGCVFKIDETQCVLCFAYDAIVYLKGYDIYLKIVQWLRTKGELNKVFFVSTERVEHTVLLSQEIGKILHMKELYFYFNEENVFLETNSAGRFFTPAIDVQVVLDAISQNIEEKRYMSITMNIKKLLELLELDGHLSPMYVKYIFFDIVKKLQHRIPEISKNRIDIILSNISNTVNIKEISEQLQPLITWLLSMDDSQTTYNQRIVERILNYIHFNYQTDISLEALAEMVSLSPAYTSTIFKQVTNQTITAYINAYRMKMAKKLLTETNKKLVEIYPLVGYSSLTYFCVLFKDMFGETPSQYRKKKKGDNTL